MEWWIVLLIAFGSLIAFLLLGLPIAFAFLALDIIGLHLLFGAKGMTLLSASIFESVAKFTLSPIPLFILLGEIFFQSHSVDIFFDAIDKLVGSVRARLHIVTLMFSTAFGAISGAAMAVVAMLGTTILPEMEKQGYDKKLSIAVILGGASLDPLIPPSVLAVLVGSLANVSIAKLLFSGFGPGFLLSASLIIYVLVSVKLNPKLAPISQISSSIREKLWSLCSMLPFGAIIFLILGLMMLGIATPTESAATGVVGALVLVASLRRLTFQVIKTSIWGTIRISAMVLLIIAGCKAFAQILAVSGATQGLVAMVVKFQLPNLILLIIMQVIALILGCFLDQVAIMLITIPVYLPVIETVGFDPLWFWCLYLINMTVGGITPPFGLVLYVLKGATPSTPLEEIFRAATPVVLMFLAGMALVIMFPEIAVWIPNWAIR